jgi:biotin-dependent carboxylase-like uncharacterized protein
MIELLSSAGLSTVQDMGRDGYLRFGVGTSGAMDRIALAVGNILLGNEENAAGIEIPILPFKVRFLENIAFALTGADCSAQLDNMPVPPWWVAQARKDQILTLRVPASGARGYLTLAGGVDVPVVLGSRSTQLRGQFGGYQGRPLQKGDVIPAIGPTTAAAAAIPLSGFGAEPPEFSLPPADHASEPGAKVVAVRVLPAAEYDCYPDDAQQAFWNAEWKITPQSDRYGYRLAGPAIAPTQAIEKRSHGIVPGVIQVPHSGQPIIQLRDAQPSGGYPKIGTVIEADLWRLGQIRIGEKLRFVKTTYEDAVEALGLIDNYLGRVRKLAELYRNLNR